MPRMAGIVIPNLPHHVTRRGNKGSVPNGITISIFVSLCHGKWCGRSGPDLV
jgi:hypothetical protein